MSGSGDSTGGLPVATAEYRHGRLIAGSDAELLDIVRNAGAMSYWLMASRGGVAASFV